MAASLRHEDDEDGGGIIAEINITPLTDVFLVLLIIFMVTSSVIANTGKKVDLPEAVQQSQTPPKAVNVTIEGRLKKSEGTVLQLEASILSHKGFVVFYEMACEPGMKEKYKKELSEIEKSFKL